MASRATPTYSGRAGIDNSTTASGWVVLTGPRLPSLDGVERLGLVLVDVEDLGQPGDFEDAQDARVVADQAKVAVALARSLQAADQHPEAGAVEVLDLRGVHDDAGDA